MPDPRPNIRKSIHIALMEDTHANLRILLFRKKLSMQETIEEFCQLIAAEDPRVIRIVNGLALRKKNKIVRSLAEPDAKTLLDEINRESPFGSQFDGDEE